MKTLLTSLCTALLVTAVAGRAEEPAKHFAVVSMGAVDTQLVASAAAWAAQNTALPVQVAAPLPGKADSLEDAVTKAIQARRPGQVGLIVLVQPKDAAKAHGIMRPEEGVAVVNVAAMASDGAAADKVQFRVDRQVIRAICLLSGLSFSPNPQSAMFDYNSLEQLDQVGRNLDPPWLMKLQQAAQQKGVRVDADSPFCLIN